MTKKQAQDPLLPFDSIHGLAFESPSIGRFQGLHGFAKISAFLWVICAFFQLQGYQEIYIYIYLVNGMPHGGALCQPAGGLRGQADVSGRRLGLGRQCTMGGSASTATWQRGSWHRSRGSGPSLGGSSVSFSEARFLFLPVAKQIHGTVGWL